MEFGHVIDSGAIGGRRVDLRWRQNRQSEPPAVMWEYRRLTGLTCLEGLHAQLNKLAPGGVAVH